MPSTLPPRTRTAVTGGLTTLLVASATMSAAEMIGTALPMPTLAFLGLVIALGMVLLTAAVVLAVRRTRYAAYVASAAVAWLLGAASDTESLLLNGFSPYLVVSLLVWLATGGLLLGVALYRHGRE